MTRNEQSSCRGTWLHHKRMQASGGDLGERATPCDSTCWVFWKAALSGQADAGFQGFEWGRLGRGSTGDSSGRRTPKWWARGTMHLSTPTALGHTNREPGYGQTEGFRRSGGCLGGCDGHRTGPRM